MLDRLSAIMKDITTIEKIMNGGEDTLAPMLEDIKTALKDRMDELEVVQSTRT